jgi:hypothetical protein
MKRHVLALIVALRWVSPIVVRAEEEKGRSTHVELGATGAMHQLVTGFSAESGPNASEHPLSTAIPITGVGGTIGTSGFASPEFGWRAAVRYEMGSTDGGLRTHLGLLEVDSTWILSKKRTVAVFVGPRAGMFFVERATRSAAISHWCFGLGAGANLDLITLGHGAVFLRPELQGILIPHSLTIPRSFLWGGDLAVGVRL